MSPEKLMAVLKAVKEMAGGMHSDALKSKYAPKPVEESVEGEDVPVDEAASVDEDVPAEEPPAEGADVKVEARAEGLDESKLKELLAAIGC